LKCIINQPEKIKGEYVMIKTNEGANAFKDAISMTVEFFSKAGSLFVGGKRKPYYSNEATALELFKKSFNEDVITSMKLSMWLRDCRGGAGNRSGAKSIIRWLGKNHTELMKANMHFIPVHGRWDDLVALFTTPLRSEAGAFWANAIDGGDILAAKWAKRHYKPIREALGLKESEFRKLLASIRKDHIVEHKMCQKQWNKIDYKKVPSVAMARYTRAFDTNDHLRFQKYKDALVKGETTIHADTLFPHDCIRTALNGDGDIAEAQFNALPNYLEGTDEQIMVICDTSGSMTSVIGGSVRAIHVSQGMALYCSSRLPENSPFYKRFIGFGSEGKFVDWRKHTFKTALRDRKVFDGAVASTRIDRALDLILKIAVEREIKQELMPTTLLIVSDMQFTQGATSSSGWNTHGLSEEKTLTEIQKSMNKWNDAGYKTPKIVYWNTAGYDGQQDTVNSPNVGLVSGFSPSICKAVFSGEDFSPYAIMLRAIEKYEVVVPRNME
jgi:hypothetical protein